MSPDLSTIAARLDLVSKFAVKYGLNPALVCAVCEQESAWCQWAIRYEPAFEERYVAGQGHDPTEQKARSISWGLMQVMGEVAREQGYNYHLAGLCDPENGLEAGCRKLRACMDARNGDTAAALEHWNGGADPDYAKHVLARMANYGAA